MKVELEISRGSETAELSCYGRNVPRVVEVLARWGFAVRLFSAKKTIESRITRITREEQDRLLADLQWPLRKDGLLFDVSKEKE